MTKYTIQERMRELGYDFTVVRQKLIFAYIQSGLPVPSDNTIRNRITGEYAPKDPWDLDLLCLVLKCKVGELEVGRVRRKKGESNEARSA